MDKRILIGFAWNLRGVIVVLDVYFPTIANK